MKREDIECCISELINAMNDGRIIEINICREPETIQGDWEIISKPGPFIDFHFKCSASNE